MVLKLLTQFKWLQLTRWPIAFSKILMRSSFEYLYEYILKVYNAMEYGLGRLITQLLSVWLKTPMDPKLAEQTRKHSHEALLDLRLFSINYIILLDTYYNIRYILWLNNKFASLFKTYWLNFRNYFPQSAHNFILYFILKLFWTKRKQLVRGQSCDFVWSYANFITQGYSPQSSQMMCD